MFGGSRSESIIGALRVALRPGLLPSQTGFAWPVTGAIWYRPIILEFWWSYFSSCSFCYPHFRRNTLWHHYEYPVMWLSVFFLTLLFPSVLLLFDRNNNSVAAKSWLDNVVVSAFRIPLCDTAADDDVSHWRVAAPLWPARSPWKVYGENDRISNTYLCISSVCEVVQHLRTIRQ